MWVDPGIGFGKTAEHNLALLPHLASWPRRPAAEGFGVLVGTSRKSFLGRRAPATASRAAAGRPPGGVAGHGHLGHARGAAMVRVHDVAPTVEAARLVGGEWGAAA